MIVFGEKKYNGVSNNNMERMIGDALCVQKGGSIL